MAVEDPPIRTKLDKTRVDCATSNVNAEHPRALAYDSARQRRFEYFRTLRAMRKFFADAPATVRHRAEASPLNVSSKFPEHSAPFISVLFNHYSTNAADGNVSA